MKALPDADGRSGELRWMDMAIRLARKGFGLTSPNPMVGAVVVSESGELLGKGWHRGPGSPHAEVLALAQAGDRARNSTVFVNLEPCSHHGRTPPCVDALLAAKVRRVVCAVQDPDPRVAGEGLAALRGAGVEGHLGPGRRAAADLNRAYMTHRSKGRPYVTLKMAISLDGKTSAADGSARWISGEAARKDVHRLRATADAVCVGVGTILADDPALTARGVKGAGPRWKVVLDSVARTPANARLFAEGPPTLVFVTQRAPKNRLNALTRSGAEIVVIESDTGRVPSLPVLQELAGRQVMDLLLEGGPRLAASFAATGLIDRYLFYVAPKLLGDGSAGSIFQGWAARSIDDARPLRISSSRRYGQDLRIEAFPAEEPGGSDE